MITSSLSGDSAELKVGSDDMLYLTSNINIPLTDGFYSKISVTNRDREHYVKREQLGECQLSGIAATTGGVDLGDDNSKFLSI